MSLNLACIHTGKNPSVNPERREWLKVKAE